MSNHTRGDSSGTEDDLLNHDIIRTSRGLLQSGAVMTTSGPVSREMDRSDMKFQVHNLEMEAYGAVLRAFFAQSDSLSWGKESLLTDLRKELRVSLDEHSEILGTINSDQSIKALREWRTINDAQKLPASLTGFNSNPVVHASRKKLKTVHSTALSSPRYPLSGQPSPATIPSTITVQVRDDHRGTDATLLSSHSNVGMTGLPAPKNRPLPTSGPIQGPLSVEPSVKGLGHTGFEPLKMDADIIRIRATHVILHEVEKICGENPDLVQVQKAKLILREHEKALLAALAKLADVPDGSPDQRHYEEPHRSAQEFNNAAYAKR